MLAVRRPRQDCWLMESVVDVHICNDLRPNTNFIEKPIRVGGSTTDGVSPSRGIVWIRLVLEDEWEGVILNLRNVFYLPNSPFNLVSLSFLNDNNIFYDNEHHTLYNKTSQRPLAFAQRWEQSFLPHPINFSILAIKLLKVKNDNYQEVEPKIHVTQSNKLPLTVWHKRFGHLNFLALRKHLICYIVHYIKDKRICDSCKRAKAMKHYNLTPQERAKRVYQFIHTELVGPITPMGFKAERYFFTFTDD